MERHTILFVTDQRQKHLAECLANRTEVVPVEQAAREAFRPVIFSAERIILPTPVSKLNQKKEEFHRMLPWFGREQLLFGGKLPADLQENLRQRQIPFYDLMEDETVTLENAGITAEAVVAEVISRSSYSVKGQKIIITGYGRCAKAAAEKLAALGAKITILARSREARKAAHRDGYCAVDFAYGPQEAYGTRTFINTVPARVVNDQIFAEMHKDALVLDIASSPGGCDLEAAKKYGIKVIPALGLPGIYTTKSSAIVLADAIQRKTYSERGKKEEKSWIFQILISDME